VRRRRRGTNEPNLFKTMRTGFRFSCENPTRSLSFKNNKKIVQVLLVGSHMGDVRTF
jgi:hypothetical protein